MKMTKIVIIVIRIIVFRASTKALPLASACLPPDRSMFLAAQVSILSIHIIIIIISIEILIIIMISTYMMITTITNSNNAMIAEADLQPDEV